MRFVQLCTPMLTAWRLPCQHYRIVNLIVCLCLCARQWIQRYEILLSNEWKNNSKNNNNSINSSSVGQFSSISCQMKQFWTILLPCEGFFPSSKIKFAQTLKQINRTTNVRKMATTAARMESTRLKGNNASGAGDKRIAKSFNCADESVQIDSILFAARRKNASVAHTHRANERERENNKNFASIIICSMAENHARIQNEWMNGCRLRRTSNTMWISSIPYLNRYLVEQFYLFISLFFRSWNSSDHLIFFSRIVDRWGSSCFVCSKLEPTRVHKTMNSFNCTKSVCGFVGFIFSLYQLPMCFGCRFPSMATIELPYQTRPVSPPVTFAAATATTTALMSAVCCLSSSLPAHNHINNINKNRGMSVRAGNSI